MCTCYAHFSKVRCIRLLLGMQSATDESRASTQTISPSFHRTQDSPPLKGILAGVVNLKNVLCTHVWGMFLTLICEGVSRRHN